MPRQDASAYSSFRHRYAVQSEDWLLYRELDVSNLTCPIRPVMRHGTCLYEGKMDSRMAQVHGDRYLLKTWSRLNRRATLMTRLKARVLVHVSLWNNAFFMVVECR
jgi:hypothetical protein